MPNTYDDNFSTVHIPPPISDFMTETVGGIDMNQCACKGDFYLDGVLTNTYTPQHSVSGTLYTTMVSAALGSGMVKVLCMT